MNPYDIFFSKQALHFGDRSFATVYSNQNNQPTEILSGQLHGRELLINLGTDVRDAALYAARCSLLYGRVVRLTASGTEVIIDTAAVGDSPLLVPDAEEAILKRFTNIAGIENMTNLQKLQIGAATIRAIRLYDNHEAR